MTIQQPKSTRVPSTNKKIFVLSFIVSIIAILAFISFIRFSIQNQSIAVDKAVMEERPDPTKVFDVFLSEAKLAYIDLEKYSQDVGVDSSADQSNQSSVEGKIGCGDGLVFHTIPAGEEAGIDQADRVNFILSKLLNPALFTEFKNSKAGEGVNAYSAFGPSSRSKLTLRSMQVTSEKVIIKLTGSIQVSGVCDAPRVTAQLTQTLGQFFPGQAVSILINDVPLETALSQR